MSQSITDKHKKFLFGSIFISLFMHVAEINFLQYHALWFSSPSPQGQKSDWASSMEKKEKDQILKETFLIPASAQVRSNSQKTAPLSSTVSPTPHNDLLSFSLPKISPEHPPHQIVFSHHLLPEVPLTHLQKQVPTLRAPKENISLLPSLPKELLLPKTLTPLENDIQPSLIATSLERETPRAQVQRTSIKDIAIAKPSNSSWKQAHFLGTILKEPSLPSLPKIPSLSELQASSYSSSFETELVFFEMQEGEYLFALTLIPREDLRLTPLKQNYIFLIDRSNSIQKERLTASKNAVRKAIDELQENDQFNIIAFDQKIDKLAPNMLPPSTIATAKAHDFLNKIELGSFFSQKNLYKPMFLTIPHSSHPDEIYTAILITDGENLSQKTIVQSLTSEWTYMNQGKVALYTLGMNEDPHLETMNAIANLNRGKSFSSSTYRGLKRKLLKLMKTIHSPIAKNISCKAISKFSKDGIELFPTNIHAPHLFQNEPYTILGRASSLEDFVLFVQGRLNGEWLHIKKNISFANGKKGTLALKSEWAQYKAFALYDEYLKGSGINHLAEAQSLLKNHDLPEIFEAL